jgi:hypothetical protein
VIPPFFAPLPAQNNTQKITLNEGSHERIEVKLVSKSVSDAEVAKF